jgi:hypothetical protein
VINNIANGGFIRFVNANVEPTPAEIRSYVDGGRINLVGYIKASGIWVLVVGYDDVDLNAIYTSDPSGAGCATFDFLPLALTGSKMFNII